MGTTTTAANVEQLAATIAEGVERLTTGEAWQHLLSLAGRLPRYSARNLLALAEQAHQRGMSITAVGGYRRWQELGRQVRKGEKSFRILAPVTYREDPDPVTGEKGKRVVRGFTTAATFDISQTDGPELPERPQLLAGQAPDGLWDALAALVAADGYTLHRADDCAPALGRTVFDDRTVTVRTDLSELQSVKTLAHELGHIRADHFARMNAGQDRITRSRAEVEAESIACVILAAHGQTTDTYTLPYVAGWAGGDASSVVDALSVITRTASAILDQIEAVTGE